MKNIELTEKKLNNLLIMIEKGATHKRLQPDDLEYVRIMSGRYLRELELIKTTIKMAEDKLDEKEFKELIVHIDSFAKKAHQLIKA